MYRWKSLAALVLLGVACSVALAQRGTELTVVETFAGSAKNDKKPDLKGGFIATQAKWKEAWKKVNPKAKLPKVDFTKHILLVSEQDTADPNRSSVTVVKDAKGTVSLSIFSTLIGFTPSGTTKYTFHKVDRKGLTGVNQYDTAKGAMVVTPLPKPEKPSPDVEP
jgi:hypothetical protein